MENYARIILEIDTGILSIDRDKLTEELSKVSGRISIDKTTSVIPDLNHAYLRKSIFGGLVFNVVASLDNLPCLLPLYNILYRTTEKFMYMTYQNSKGYNRTFKIYSENGFLYGLKDLPKTK